MHKMLKKVVKPKTLPTQNKKRRHTFQMEWEMGRTTNNEKQTENNTIRIETEGAIDRATIALHGKR